MPTAYEEVCGSIWINYMSYDDDDDDNDDDDDCLI